MLFRSKDAQDEGNKAAERSFKYANEVEKIHADLYEKALANMDGMTETNYYVCPVCGYTCETEAPDKCPICGAAKVVFKEVV